MNIFIYREKNRERRVSIQRIVLCILLFFVSLSAFSQATYPVQVYTQLTPPYTPLVPSYYTGAQEKLSVTLVNTDMKQPLLSVYLRMKITSSSFSLITPNEVFTPQIELQAGMPLKLSLDDLAVYFKKENVRVSGGQNEFYRTQLLPDNFYRFNFEVYEVNTNKLLSNPKMGFAQTMIASGEPPVLTMPKKGDIVVEKNIPNIFFSWIPRHMNSIAAAYGTEYEFTMVEIYDKRVAPEAAFDYSRVLYTETTKSTSFIHTAAQPILQPGLRYAWRVRVVAREGVDEISIFKNGGYSPVFWFDYTMDCKPVHSTGAIYERDHINITWVETEASDYVVEYRKKGSSKWYIGNITSNHCPIYNLKLGGEYEYRVGSRCLTSDPYQYSEIKGFRLPAQEERSPNCGLMPNTKISNQTPARELQTGLPVLVGDFPVFITKVSGSGRFSGEGYVGIPYLQGAQMSVMFKDIVVNTDNQLISGFFETKYDIKNNNMLIDLDQTLTGGKGVGDIRTGEEKAAFKVDYTINPNIKAKVKTVDNRTDNITDGGEYNASKGENEEHKDHVVIELTDDKGNKKEIITDRIPATIEDASGKTYEVDKDGNISLVSQVSDIKLDDKTKNNQRSDIATLSFRESSNSKYALDEYKDIYAKVTEYYEKYKVEGTGIEASAKFILPGASDEVEVYIKDSKKGFVADSVHFVTAAGKEYTSKYNKDSETWTLTVVGSEANDGQEVFAVQRLKDGSIATLGKLNIFSYEPLERTVYLVSVNGATNSLTEQSVHEGLDKIYGKIGITWNVKFLESGFEYTPKNGSTFNVTGSGLFSTLTDDMKVINEAFKTSGNYQEDGLYLFVLPYQPSDKGESMNASGDMPLGSQFGYLFPAADAHTIAHEVGHGAFNLEHPFSRSGRNSFSKGDLKNNLMDYTSGTEFAKIQWDATRAPGLVIGLFQKDKSGMFVDGLEESQNISDPGFEAQFYVGNKKYLIEFGEQLKDLSNSKIITQDNKTYLVVRLVSDNSLAGFYEEKSYLTLKNSKDGTVDLGSKEAQLISQFNNFRIKEIIKLSKGTTELKDALLGNNNFSKVQAIITLREALTEDEYLSVFNNAQKDDDCRIDLNVQKKYTDECLDRYIKALASELNSQVEYYDETCQCIIKHSNKDLLGNSDSEFQEWFESLGGASAIKEIENRIYEGSLARYNTNISKAIYGADEYGMILVPQALKERLRIEARQSAFPSLKAAWAILKSDADPNGLSFNFNPFSLERISYYHFRALAVTDYEDGKAILTEVGLQVAIQWVFEIIPAIKTAKGQFGKWKSVKIEPDDFVANLEKQGHHIVGADDQFVYIRNNVHKEAKVPYGTRNFDNLEWLERGLVRESLGEEAVEVFVKKTYSQQIDEIRNIWRTRYPIEDMLGGRSFFEDLMGRYRYTKSSGWSHTGDISPNYKGIDFYKGTSVGNDIYAETAVSMKTTIVKDVDQWLASEPIKKNIEFLENGMSKKGLSSNGTTMYMKNAEIHIYMPKENITPALQSDWTKKLSTIKNIKFEIKALEDFIK